MAIKAEVENIALYDRLLPAIADDSVRHVLQNLQDASRDNHLPAFRRCLERENGGDGSGGARDGQGSQGRHGRGRGPRGGCSI